MSESVAKLVVTYQGTTSEYLLAQPSMTVGRDLVADVVLADPAVSRQHLVFERHEGGRFTVRDSGSRHGTYHAGRRINEHLLAPDDELVIGATRIRFVAPSKVPTAPSVEPLVVVAVSEPRIQSAYEILHLEDLQRQYEKLRVALELTRSIGLEHDLDRLVQRILDAAMELTVSDCGALVLVDGAEAVTKETTRWRSEVPEPVMPSTRIFKEVLERRAPVVTSDPLADTRFSGSESILMLGVNAVISVPLLFQDEILGVLQLEWRGAPRVVDEREVDLVSAIAAQAALAIKSALLVEEATRSKLAEWARLERALRDLPVGLVVLDGDARVTATNPLGDRFLERAGVDRSVPVERLGESSLESALRQSEKGVYEVILGGARSQLFAVSLARSQAPGGSRDIVMVMRDVSAERERETQLSRQERFVLVGRLAGGIAHDFNNILAVISSCAEYLGETAREEVHREDAREILRETKRGASLVKQLMEFSRREPGHPEDVDLGLVIDGMSRLVARTLGADCELSLEAPAGLGAVRADRTKLEQLLLNLVVNARDAMPRGGKLRIGLSRAMLSSPKAGPEEDLPAGEYVALEVADTGAGMTADTMSQIFEPFFTTKRAGSGTGLGLATVYGIVKQANGAIGVESTVGGGTTFTVILPVTAKRAVEAESTPSASEFGPSGTETLVLVDDEEALRVRLARALRRAGYKVIDTGRPHEALAKLGADVGAKLLITDVAMPEMSGVELASSAQRYRADLKVLLITGFRGDTETGDYALMQKPFTERSFLERVRELLNHA